MDTTAYKYIDTMCYTLYVFLSPLIVGAGRMSTDITSLDYVDEVRSFP